MLAGTCLDLKAARPVAGLLDATSHHVCSTCDIFHQESVLRTDYERWGSADNELIREGMRKWREAETEDERKIVEEYYGTRCSALEILDYWQFALQIIADPMHAFYHRIVHVFFRQGLRLTTLSSNPPPPYQSNIAFHYHFTPPPPPKITAIQARMCTSDEFLAYLDWRDLSTEESRIRLARIDSWLVPLMQHDTCALYDVVRGHQLLSQKLPKRSSEQKRLQQELADLRWHSILYICNDLWIVPVKDIDDIIIEKNSLSRSRMAHSLMSWRKEAISNDNKFRWPHFNMRSCSNPLAPWAPLSTFIVDFVNDDSITLTDSERRQAMKDLADTMTYETANRIGSVHRWLCQPLYDQEKLEKSLDTAPRDALLFITKDMLIKQLIRWRITKPVEALLWPEIHSGEVLSRVHTCIQEILVPSWVHKPPFDTGLKSGGTLKAEDWRILSTLYLPVALLSLWQGDSPIKAGNFAAMESVLSTSMHLTCATVLMGKRTMPADRRDRFLHHYTAHVEGLKANFPGFRVPTHHIGFHIYNFIRLFGPVRNFWCFPGERLIGLWPSYVCLFSVDMKVGQFESTLLHFYMKGVLFRRWLLRPDCPPALRECRNILNKAYNFTFEEQGFGGTPSGSQKKKIPRDLARLLDASDIRGLSLCSSTDAPNGLFTVVGSSGPGNSSVCFRVPGETEWRAGQIKYIFQRKGDCLQFAIR
ncbi:hypothetical protein GYMLUDRAFT_244248 [Collybiopsis luxurians FD-317 M1]|uniref:Uncharacterized protein n=1 Tax=Collybiopsis luxurians FD-317 M1 TaxID=944289 RepID=A0A0D0CWY5_9AGAR|nr:hypothetical protein GYMLUDRAFT_244248 [Collybiopsis luxurians FD-317 M1]